MTTTSARSLDEVLRRLSDTGIPRPERRELERELGALVTERLKALLARWTDASRFIDDAVSHVLERATRGENGYRGEHGDASAWSWVQQIARNYIRAQLERERRAAARAQREAEARRLAARADAEEETTFALARALFERLKALTASGRHASEWNDYVHLAFTARWNFLRTQDELQHEGGYNPSDPDPNALQRARDRLAQKRRRGRVRLGELLGVLVDEGMDPDEAALLAAEHRAPYPPPPRKRVSAN